MNGNTAFAVPKDRQGVTVRLSTGVTVEGEIFLESVSEGLSIHQKVTAFLENSGDFFPIRIKPGGSTEFINKKNVRMVSVNFPENPETSYFAHLYMHSIPITAYFNDGNTVSGELMAEVPREKARLSDCLNLLNKFLDVKTEEMMCYLNKETLQKVVYKEKA